MIEPRTLFILSILYSRPSALQFWICFKNFKHFFKKKLCISILPGCMYVHHVCEVPIEARRGNGSLETGATGGCQPVLVLEIQPRFSVIAASALKSWSFSPVPVSNLEMPSYWVWLLQCLPLERRKLKNTLQFIILFYEYGYFACYISVIHALAWCLQRLEEGIRSSGTGITDVSWCVYAGNWNQVLWKIRTISWAPFCFAFKGIVCISSLMFLWL